MVTLWKYLPAGGVLLALLLLAGFPVSVLARNGLSGTEPGEADTPDNKAAVERPTPSSLHEDASSESEPVLLAALESFTPTLPQFTAAALPQSPLSDVALEFRSADDFRASLRVPEAVRAYVQLIEDYPGTAQAITADKRIDYLIELSSPEELDAMEIQLPPEESLKTVDGITIVAQFYFLRGMKCVESDPERGLAYFTRACDMAWAIMQGKLDDPFKIKILEAYLAASDAIGQGEAIRPQLSAYADTIPPCFTSWIIKVMVDGNELPFDYVTSFEAQAAVRGYYMKRAQESTDSGEATAYFSKARDASLQMLLAQPSDHPAFDLCHGYLEAAAKLGKAERNAAVAKIEGLIASQPLSVMRWVMRYELAVHLTLEGSSEKSARAGYLHFGIMTTEAESGIIDPAINDTQVDERTRGLLMCVLGHAYYGTNRVDMAEAHYQWVLEYFPHESHPGESAAYSLVEVNRRKNYDDPAQVVSAYEDFVTKHPSSSYSSLALVRIAQQYERENDRAGASRAYQRVLREYAGSSMAKTARAGLDSLAAGQRGLK